MVTLLAMALLLLAAGSILGAFSTPVAIDPSLYPVPLKRKVIRIPTRIDGTAGSTDFAPKAPPTSRRLSAEPPVFRRAEPAVHNSREARIKR